MTREMNKLDWHNKWVCISLQNGYGEFIKIEPPKERKLNPDIAEFFWATVERYRK